MREAVLAQLPVWARRLTKTDSAGNLVLTLGKRAAGDHGPDLVFDAHMDEIGYEVTHNSNIDPPADVARVIRMARSHNIPVQYGATGGGNDGAAYTRYGTVDVAMGWPMIYSHSPVETASTEDVAALSRIVTVLATEW